MISSSLNDLLLKVSDYLSESYDVSDDEECDEEL